MGKWIRHWLYLKRGQKRLREAGVKMTMRKLKRILDESGEPDLPIRYAPWSEIMAGTLGDAKESVAIFEKLITRPPQ